MSIGSEITVRAISLHKGVGMKRDMLVVVVCALLFIGCNSVETDTVCPSGTIGTSWSTHDSNVGGTLVAAGLSAAGAAGFMARLKATPPKETTIIVKSTYPW